MRRIISSIVLFMLISAILCGTSEAWVIERRKTQFFSDKGYYLFPIPYSLPGIGEGLAILGALMNSADTYTDAYLYATSGDLRSLGLSAADVHIIPRTLILDMSVDDVSSITATNYSQRGMNTDEHDYTIIEFSDMFFYGGRLTATFYDRRFEMYGIAYRTSSTLDSIRTPEGDVILDVENAPKERGRLYKVGTRIDITDDYADPRLGIRFEASRAHTPPRDSIYSDYYVNEYNATGYVPIGRRSTWTFNYFRSDADVSRKGETDRAEISQQLDLDCSTITDPEEQQQCEDVIDNIIASNIYGTASPLGGWTRLRSYPSSRYFGAHTFFYGTEIRWNLTEERTPFDIYIMKDIRTVWQAALFYEAGSVADKRDELGDIMRSSYGLGLRMVTASGVVFRADFATGREGIEVSLIIGYPWEGF